MTIYLQNRDMIAAHNARFEKGEVSYSMKMNQFGDMLPEEFEAMQTYKPQEFSEETPLFMTPANFKAPSKLLISKGADVNLYSGQGFTPIYQASMADQPNIVKILIEAGADVNTPDEDDLMPIHVAARGGCGEVAMLLVKAKADLTAKNNEGKTASELADFVNEQEMKNFLVSCAGGKIPDTPPKAAVREAPVMREIVVPEGWGPG